MVDKVLKLISLVNQCRKKKDQKVKLNVLFYLGNYQHVAGLVTKLGTHAVIFQSEGVEDRTTIC